MGQIYHQTEIVWSVHDTETDEENRILGASVDSFSIFVSPPSFVVSHCLVDIWGVSYPHML